jgi:hypothetical protein
LKVKNCKELSQVNVALRYFLPNIQLLRFVIIGMSFVKNIPDSDVFGIFISILIGISGIAIGVMILWQGYFSTLPKIDDYVTKEVIFEDCSIDERKDINLKFKGELYKLNHTLLVNAENPNIFLCNGSETTVWIHKNADSPFEIRGIKNFSYQIPIERGLVLDDYSQLIIFGWILVFCGFVVLILGVISQGSLLTF